jgi:hypothetical protein
MPLGKHSLVENAKHEDSGGVATEEHYMATLFDTPAPCAQVFAGPTQHGVFGDAVETVVQLRKIPGRLSIAPASAREFSDVVEVGSRSAAEKEARHRISRALGAAG